MTNTPQGFAALVQTWRDAVVAHKAACERMAKEGETPELDALQGDACHQESGAAHALAEVRSTDPVLLRGHAELLEAEIDDLDPVSPQCTLAASIVAELRAIADEREGRAPHPLLAAVEAAKAEADRHDQSPNSAEFDAACSAVADAQEAVMRCGDLVPALLDKQADLAESYIDPPGDTVLLMMREAFERNTRALSRMVERSSLSPVMDAAVRLAAARDEFERLDAEHGAMFTGPGGTDNGLSDPERKRIEHHGQVVDRAADQHWAWHGVVCAHAARDLDDAAVHVVMALDCVETLKTAAEGSTDYVSAALRLPRLLWSVLGVLDVGMVPASFLRFYLGGHVNPWTGAVLVEGGRDDD